jgi:hypothetical protein
MMAEIRLNVKKIVDKDTAIEIEIVGASKTEIVDTAKDMLTWMSKTD